MSAIFTNFSMHKLMGKVTCHERHLLTIIMSYDVMTFNGVSTLKLD
jgi:hypothetical protein